MKIFGALCLTGLLGASAFAGTVTLFDNTSQTVAAQDSVALYSGGGTDVNSNPNLGSNYVEFETDSNTWGDTLQSLTVSLLAANPSDGGSVEVNLLHDSGGNPGQ